jgi:hypothetical protein
MGGSRATIARRRRLKATPAEVGQEVSLLRIYELLSQYAIWGSIPLLPSGI